MSESLCYLCNQQLTWNADSTDEGFWAVTVADSRNPGVARANPVHTKCVRENHAESFELARRYLTEMSTGSTT